MTVQELLKKSWSLRHNVVDIIMAGGGGRRSAGMSSRRTATTWTRVDGNSIEALDAAFTAAKHHAGTLRMAQDAGLSLSELRADGGPTANKYLMQFQSDIAQVTVSVSDVAELSGFGAACAAGFSCGLYDPETIFANTHRSCFTPEMDHTEREARCNGWQKAVRQALTR